MLTKEHIEQLIDEIDNEISVLMENKKWLQKLLMELENGKYK